MTSDLTHLARALAVRAITRDQQRKDGAQAVLRGEAMTGAYDDHPVAAGASMFHDEMMALGIADMPPSPDYVSLLLDVIAVREGISRAMAWQSIGIEPERGRKLLTRNAGAVDWPIWRTLREEALDGRP